ncbi:MAG: NAD-dependent epimerase/dehydratase family protein [Cyclobacteriaceae bacterium]|nr:NAD-dependent epimerase/dehydratase family protein [Cyclobacteriaceae bacterium]MCH8515272.1 NAD-dependent epimerase/dehydratase family protein [Cyclobacteriaceae bacterium]
MTKILVTGANGQLGTELTEALREKYGAERVLATDIRKLEGQEGLFEVLDVMDAERMLALVKDYGITQIYHLAAMLSARGEQNPELAWDLNMNSLLNVLNIARSEKLDKVYWPSSIAVFGPQSPKKDTPQHTIMEPNTIYGISKLAGERWCEYYHDKYGVDVRSLRYPGLIGYKSTPGGGTTDYAVSIYHDALAGDNFTCFLDKHTYLPMMFMSDAIQATIQLMEAPREAIKVRSSYNVSAMSFSPEEVAASIKKHIPDFKIDYAPDFREKIAQGWPDSIDDQAARSDWAWKESVQLEDMTEIMLREIKLMQTI